MPRACSSPSTRAPTRRSAAWAPAAPRGPMPSASGRCETTWQAVRTGGRAKKSAAGYDLTRIFVGSEGTLGIITEVTVRLYPRPEAVSAAVCPFPGVVGAVNTVIRTIQRGVPIARAELLDALTVTVVNRYSKTTLKEQPTLFLEFHGTRRASRSRPRPSRTGRRRRAAPGRSGRPAGRAARRGDDVRYWRPWAALPTGARKWGGYRLAPRIGAGHGRAAARLDYRTANRNS